MEVLILILIVIVSLFFDIMIYLHFNTLFEGQFNLTNKLISMVKAPIVEDETDENQTTLESFTGEE